MKHAHQTSSAARTLRGMTVVELLIAMTITVVVGLAMATVLTSVARGLSSTNGERSAMQRANVLSHRLTSYTQAALAITASDDRGFAMWLHDESGEGMVNLLELRVFWVDVGAQTVAVERVVFPVAWTPEDVVNANTLVASIEDPFVVIAQQRSLGYTDTTLLVDGMAAVSVIPGGATAVSSSRFAMIVDLQVEMDRTEQILLSVALPMYQEPL